MAMTNDEAADFLDSLMQVTKKQAGVILTQLEAGVLESPEDAEGGQALLDLAIKPDPAVPAITEAKFAVDTTTAKWVDSTNPCVTGYELGFATKDTDDPTATGDVIKPGVQTDAFKDGAKDEYVSLRVEYTAKAETAGGYDDLKEQLTDWGTPFKITA